MPKRKYSPEEVKAEMATWGKEPSFVTSELHEQQIVRSRIDALKMYGDGYSLEEITKRTGVEKSLIVKLFEKAMRRADDGKPMGYAALYPYARRKDTTRVSKIQRVMNEYPGLEKKIVDSYFSLRSGESMKRRNKKTSHAQFLDELLKAGHDLNSYPFTLSDCGRRNFCAWLDNKEIEKNLFLTRQRQEARVEDRKAGGMYNRLLNPAYPYQIIEIDGHRLDFVYAVEFYDEEGHLVREATDRPWLLAAIDVKTRCIVSYRIVFDKEYSSVDVLKLIEGITKPYEGLPGIRKDGMPSQVFEQAKYALPDMIMLDNALAHYAEDLRDKEALYGYIFNYGPVADPTKRPHVERFFGTFETKWGHKLPSTTGSGVNDIRRIEAEKDACRFGFGREQVSELIAMAVATYNNTMHRGLKGMTPIGMMRKCFNLGQLPNRLGKEYRAGFKLYFKRTAHFRGNKEQGKRVYVQINNLRYTSERIGRNYHWIGKKVTLLIDPDNVTSIRAFSENDTDLGLLLAKGRSVIGSVGIVSLKENSEAHDYLKEKKIPYSYGLDDVEKYISELKKHPGTKTNLRKLDNIRFTNSVETESEKPAFQIAGPLEEIENEVSVKGTINRSMDKRTPEEIRDARRRKYDGYFK